MKIPKPLVCFLSFLFISLSSFSQKPTQINYWEDFPENQIQLKSTESRQIIPNQYRLLKLDIEALTLLLNTAPKRFTSSAAETNLLISIPMPDGSIEEFRMEEAPLMPEGLASRYPEIKSWQGQGIQDPTALLRCDISHKGFRAMILSNRKNTVFIDPYAAGNTDYYLSYFKKDFHKVEAEAHACNVDDLNFLDNIFLPELPKAEKKPAQSELNKNLGDCQLRTYRLALACSGEYATFHGGNVPDVMAEFVTAMNRINGIFERDAAITMVLVENNDDLIFLNANTDPYTNADNNAMLDENQETVDIIIGTDNYDIGHVFGTVGGGIAQLRSPCRDGSKARGTTGIGNPVNDPFYVSFVSHEMGHQYGANHTQNNDCNRRDDTAIETGSGSTIMSYAGVCAPNVQPDSDDYFNGISLAEIDENVTFGLSSSCPVTTSLGNTKPTAAVEVGHYILPVSTPFSLTCIGDDTDPNTVLTYCWEQRDNEVGTMPPLSTNPSGPVFRSISPTESPTRYFPNLDAIINNVDETWEVLPSVSRTMDFRCTVRDNNPGGGCQDGVDLSIEFVNSAGPFLVTNPNENLTWFVAATETVNWDVANTDAAPVSCSEVDILLSLDGGQNYTITLAENVSNDGAHDILVPNELTSTARVKVVCSSSVFFDISNQDFSIETPAEPTFFMEVAPNLQAVCETDNAIYTVDIQGFAGFGEDVTLTANGVPAGASVEFSNNPFVPTGISTLTISTLQDVTPGDYAITVLANSTSVNQELPINLTVYSAFETSANLQMPANGGQATVLNPELSWEDHINAESYFVEIADNPSFSAGSILESGTTMTNTYQPQNVHEIETVYYWRVKPSNPCFEGVFSEFFTFQLGTLSCQTFTAPGLPFIIPDDEIETYTIPFEVNENIDIADLNTFLDIKHNVVGDIKFTLISPNGTEAVLFDEPGVPADEPFGCTRDDILATFDDEATNTADDFENSCNFPPPAISGEFQSITPLSIFDEENSQGTWIMEILEGSVIDEGQVDVWELELCGLAENSPAQLINNLVLTVPNGDSELITNSFLFVNGAPAEEIVFTLLSIPANGQLLLGMTPLNIGDTFTQADISSDNLSYQHDGTDTFSDEFLFNAIDPSNGWLANQVFEIEIIQVILTASAEVTTSLNCTDDSDASITVTALGGMMPYQYSIDGENFQNDPVFTGLSAGTYTLTVQDNEGGIVMTNEVEIANPSPINVDATVMDDEIIVDASGGTGNLQYSIDGMNFQDDNVFSGLENGVYTVTVMDENGCSSETTAVVAVNSLVISAEITNEIECNEDNDGIIEVTVGGGAAPFQYSLDGENFQDENIFDNLPPGTYVVTVSDNEDFVATSAELTILEPDAITASSDVTNYDITINANGGTGTLMYSINGIDFQPENTFSNNPNGVYTITIMDENGCTTTVEAIVEVEAISGTISINNGISCTGESDASISANAAGGVMPYQFSLNGDEFQDSPDFNSLGAGTYEVTIMDNGGFSFTTSEIEIITPEELTATANSFGFTIEVMASGGTGDLQYSIDGTNFQNEPSFMVMDNGTYTITIQDENGCQTTVEIEVDIAALTVNAEVSIELECNGDTDGQITVDAGGGIPPYQYSLDGDNFQDENVFNNLPAGTYTVTLIDDENFTVFSNEVTIEAPAAIMASSTVNNYDITVNANGGTGTLMYSINGTDFQTENIFPGNMNGTYTITIMDENGCQITVEAIIEVELLSGSATVTNDISCFGEMDGSISTEVVGGAEPYEYSLDGDTFQDDNIFDNLPAGMYEVIIRDVGGFTFTTNTVSISSPSELEASANVFGFNIDVMASGGTGDLQYSIDGMNFQDESSFTVSDNGTYTITIQDENGCQTMVEVEINIDALSAVATLSNELSCSSASDAEITVEAIGGIPPYQYSIDGENFQDSPVFDDLPEGTYTITVIDEGGFEVLSNTIEISSPNSISVSASVSGYEITVMASGGVGNLQYSIDGVFYQSSNILTTPDNGEYLVYVQDQNGCEITILVTVNVIVDAAVSIWPILCHNLNSGRIEVVNVDGGFEPYLYSFNGGDFMDQFIWTNLEAGFYDISIRDAEGFEFDLETIEIMNPPLLDLEVETDQNNLNIIASGGTEPYQYSIDGGSNFSDESEFLDLPNGQYIVVVKDAFGCLISTNIMINVVDVFNIEEVLTFEVFPNPSSGQFLLSIDQNTENELLAKVFDLSGKLVSEEYWDKTSVYFERNLDLTYLPGGVYQLVVSDGKQIGLGRLVIIK